MANATLVVDCKRRAAPIDVKDVDSFIGLVEDVGADVGMMVTTDGSTAGARDRARAVRGVRLEVMSLEELMRWSAVGTVTTTYRVPPIGRPARREYCGTRASGSLPMRGSPLGWVKWSSMSSAHYGTKTPSGAVQQGHMTTAEAALRKVGVEPVHVAHGIVARAAALLLTDGSWSRWMGFLLVSRCWPPRKRKPRRSWIGSPRPRSVALEGRSRCSPQRTGPCPVSSGRRSGSPWSAISTDRRRAGWRCPCASPGRAGRGNAEQLG